MRSDWSDFTSEVGPEPKVSPCPCKKRSLAMRARWGTPSADGGRGQREDSASPGIPTLAGNWGARGRLLPGPPREQPRRRLSPRLTSSLRSRQSGWCSAGSLALRWEARGDWRAARPGHWAPSCDSVVLCGSDGGGTRFWQFWINPRIYSLDVPTGSQA